MFTGNAYQRLAAGKIGKISLSGKACYEDMGINFE